MVYVTRRFEKRGSQHEQLYVVYDELSGRRLGMVRKMSDGWRADRATGPTSELVHSTGHATRRAAAEVL